MLLKITALLAFVLLVQLSNANPAIDAAFDTAERAVNAMKLLSETQEVTEEQKFVSEAQEVTQDRMKRSTRVKCNDQTGRGRVTVKNCDRAKPGAQVDCFSVQWTGGNSRRKCFTVMDAISFGVLGAKPKIGCQNIEGGRLCMCKGNRCN